MPNLCLAITGASGAIYFHRLLERLIGLGLHPTLLASEAGRRVLLEECQLKWSDLKAQHPCENEKNIGASIASGSARLDALVVVPCSMSSLSQMAYGLTANLIHRVASVQLKERRSLIVVPRETPLSLIHLKAMTALVQAGATLIPAMPGFYHQPTTVEEVADTVVDRILDHLALPDPKIKRWQG